MVIWFSLVHLFNQINLIASLKLLSASLRMVLKSEVEDKISKFRVRKPDQSGLTFFLTASIVVNNEQLLLQLGLVVTTPVFQAWVRRFESPLGPQNSRLAWSLYKCAPLWRTVCGPSVTGAIRKDKDFFSPFRVSISSRYDLSCWKRRETPKLPLLLLCQIALIHTSFWHTNTHTSSCTYMHIPITST